MLIEIEQIESDEAVVVGALEQRINYDEVPYLGHVHQIQNSIELRIIYDVKRIEDLI